MITLGFTGGAGTGKTTSLLRELDAYLEENPLNSEQCVLALTFMHGSRVRLAERLAKSSAKRRFVCQTLDRFAWDICRRWRSRLRSIGEFTPSDIDEPNYDATCEAAGLLLDFSDVLRWVSTRYPIVVIDELQDCVPIRLALAQRMYGHVSMFLAADDFQNLNRSTESPGAVWLRELGIDEELTKNHRTSNSALLAVAHALRLGVSLSINSDTSFKLISAPSKHIAASFASQTMAHAKEEVVLLSTARRGNSKWVENVIELIRTKQYGKKKKVGPVLVEWEMNDKSLAEEVIAEVNLNSKDGIIRASSILALGKWPGCTKLNRWVEYQRRVLGRTEFEIIEVHNQIRRVVQQVRFLGSVTNRSRYAMTIHQAKNREFSVVIVLWSFSVVGDPILARRWLYNAITRAKQRAIVIVEDPGKNRLEKPPFANPA